MTWRWVDAKIVYAIHDMQLARHGGLEGIRDKNAVELAVGRARQLEVYGNPPPDAADLAAAYIYGLATSHGFSDGNKRTAWVIGRLFLADNGKVLTYKHIDAINVVLAVAGGRMGEKELADWLRGRITP
jgi:death-on-curing protein